MKTATKLFSAIVAAVWLIAGSAGSSFADSVKLSDSCAGKCLDFGVAGSIPAVRSIVLNAPQAGNATVTFHGTLFCLSVNSSPVTGFLATQIVEGAAEVDPTGTSALSIGPGFSQASFLYPQTFNYNLTSTRVFSIAGAGSHTYRFKIKRLVSMPADVTCSIYNGQLIVHFS